MKGTLGVDVEVAFYMAGRSDEDGTKVPKASQWPGKKG